MFILAERNKFTPSKLHQRGKPDKAPTIYGLLILIALVSFIREERENKSRKTHFV
jgi:hypothetical protein